MPGEGVEDLFGGLGPEERLGVLVPVLDPRSDAGLQVLHVLCAPRRIFWSARKPNGGRPGRGSSTRPSSRCARNRSRHLLTVSAATRNSRATTPIGGTSAPAHASTIRARRASAWADDVRRVYWRRTPVQKQEWLISPNY